MKRIKELTKQIAAVKSAINNEDLTAFIFDDDCASRVANEYRRLLSQLERERAVLLARQSHRTLTYRPFEVLK